MAYLVTPQQLMQPGPPTVSSVQTLQTGNDIEPASSEPSSSAPAPSVTEAPLLPLPTMPVQKVHPVLMVYGLILLNGEAMLAYKTVSGTKNYKKAVHLIIQLLAFCLGTIGLWAAIKFHNDKGIDNFYSLHSWLGLACLILFGVQWGLGFVTFWYPGGSRNSRAALLPWHVFFGVYIYALAVATATTGILEKTTFLQTNNIISRYSTEALLVNSLGILIVVLGGGVILALITPVNVKGDGFRGSTD